MHFKFVEHARGAGSVDIRVFVGPDLGSLGLVGGLVMRTGEWSILQSALVTLDRITRPAIRFHLPCDEEGA